MLALLHHGIYFQIMSSFNCDRGALVKKNLHCETLKTTFDIFHALRKHFPFVQRKSIIYQKGDLFSSMFNVRINKQMYTNFDKMFINTGMTAVARQSKTISLNGVNTKHF